MASALTQDPAQQQAMIAAMVSQLPPEHQAQIQEAVGNYSQQLTAQGVPAEQLQQYIWSYYTQCVTTFFAQLPAEVQQAVLASQAAPSPPQEEPQEQQAESQPEELTTEAEEIEQVPQLVSSPLAEDAEPLRLLSEQEAQALQAELQAQEMRKQQEAALKAQQTRKEQEELETQQAQQQEEPKEQQNPALALAARFAKPRENEAGDSASADTRPAASPPQNLDPVLAKRWNAMQERQAAGEDAGMSIDERRLANLAKSRQDKPESEFTKKLAKRAEKVAEGADPAISPRSQAWDAKKSQGGDSELQKRMAKQQEKNRERLETGDSPAAKPREFNSATGELAQKLARAQERQQIVEESESGNAATAQDPSTANGEDKSPAEKKCFTLPRGQTEVHTYTWPSSSSVSATNLKWNASVLDELTVDLEVVAVLKPEKEGDAPQTVILQKNARGGDHWGSLAPARDRRLVVAGDAAGAENGDGKRKHREVQSVVFTFSNSFSWFTKKEVEFETVCE